MGIAVIGSTGSIGQSTLKIVRRLGLKIDALVAFGNLELLKKQQEEFAADYIGVIDGSQQKKAAELFPLVAQDRLVMGLDALNILSALPATGTVVVAVSGVNGLLSVISAIKAGKKIALANKESLVSGGHIVKDELQNSRKSGLNPQIIPVDSEHSAIFQCMQGINPATDLTDSAGKDSDGLINGTDKIARIILTASGGAFYFRNNLDGITPKNITHPSYKMGRKITVDSCTMMNKTLEIIEAYHLFGCKNIEYVIHPQSIIHSMLQLKDGSILAQLAPPDMSLPIQYALTYPQRQPCPLPELPFDAPLVFAPKNPIFYAPTLAHYAILSGKSAGAVLNAANEAAVALFEKEQIQFGQIVPLVEKYLYAKDLAEVSTPQDVMDIHCETVQRVNADYKQLLK